MATISFILPVKGRIEVDRQATGPQAMSMEDSTACIHGSRGVRAPASKHLISEVDFIARLAEAVLEPNPKVPWKAWNDDYSLIRRSIGETYPEMFYDYDRRMWEPGGFHRDLAGARPGVEDEDRKGQHHHAEGSGRRPRHAGCRGTTRCA